MRKSWIVKKRSKKYAVCECCPPIVLLGLAMVLAGLLEDSVFGDLPATYDLARPMPDLCGFCTVSRACRPISVTGDSIVGDLDPLVSAMNVISPCVPFQRTESSLDAIFEANQNAYFAGVHVTAMDATAKTIDFTLRMVTKQPRSDLNVPETRETAGNGDSLWSLTLDTIRSSRSQFQLCPSCNNRTALPYLSSGFVEVQRTVEDAFRWSLRLNGNVNSTVPMNKFAPTAITTMPHPEIVRNPDYSLVAQYLGFSYIACTFVLASQMLGEKEKRIKEGMQIMSMKTWVFWLGWFLTGLLSVLPVSFLVLLAGVGVVFKNASFGHIFITILLFGLSLIALTFLVYTFFRKARTGGIFLLVIQIIGIIANQTLTSLDLNWSILKFISLLSPLAFLRVATLLAGGVKDINQSEYSIADGMGLLVGDILIYMLLAWYLDKVIPGEYGQNLPWYFVVSPSYWCPKKKQQAAPDVELGDPTQGDRFQAASPEVRAAGVAVRVTNLGKRFQANVFKESERDKVAVNGLSFEMYQGQVFSLLGHNGAGKTTTISMMTGMLPPSSGDIVVNGLSVRDNLAEIRRSVGFCPQHDVLYDQLSVTEHLELYGSIKGLKGAELNAEVDDLIKAVDLDQKRHNYVGELSGGMKRKLSVAIAYIGNPALVVLDEPTAGMDPLSRRMMWNLIQSKKAGRATLLTTHFMDEADILGDRIGIMANGTMKCLGTSLFLKNRFGLGYLLSFVKAPTADSERLRGYVQSVIPEADEQTCTMKEQSLRLPVARTAQFPQLLSGLRANREALGIQSFGLSITTLEEVFLSIADEADEFASTIVTPLERKLSLRPPVDHSDQVGPAQLDGEQLQHKKTNFVKLSDPLDNMSWEGAPTFGTQCHAVLLKRFWQTKRALTAFGLNLGLPTVLLILAGGLSTLLVPDGEQDPIKLDTATLIGSDFKFFYSYANNTKAGLTLTGGVSMTGSGVQYVPALDDTFAGMSAALYPLSQSDALLKVGGGYTITPAAPRNQTGPFPAPQYDVTFWTNRRLVHSLPLMVSEFYRTIENEGVKATVTAHPLVYKSGQAPTSVFIFISFFVFAFAFVPGYVGVAVVTERVNKTRHLMRLMGMKMGAYWLVTAACDFLYFLVPTILAIISISAFGVEPYSGGARGAVVLLLLLYNIAVIPFTYVFSRLMDKPENFQLASIGINMLLGLIGVIAYLVLDLLAITMNDDGLRVGSEVIFYILNFIPLFNVSVGLYRVGTPPKMGIQWKDLSFSDVLDPDTMVGAGIGYQVMNIVLYSALVVLFEQWDFISLIGAKKISPKKEGTVTDKDVLAERARIESHNGVPQDTIELMGLRKVFPARDKVPEKVANHETFLGIAQGEVFGMLGANGAGKTTCMKMLTGDIKPTDGTAYVNGNNITTDMQKAYEVMGYCPQFDALWGDLTGREHLRIFSMIKGVPATTASQLAERMLTRMSLGPYADKLAGTYSGGNKRKLSVTVALMANPKVVYLDEPSTGMDPASRRFMWDVISSSMASRAVILTTHSMEEADALCNRIGIVVNGELHCLGSAQHLKDTFGAGYQIAVHTSKSQDDVMRFVNGMFTNVNVVDSYGGAMSLEVVSPNIDLGRVFEAFEANKVQLGITDYSVSQTTLEQVFLRFARGQIVEDS